MFRELSLNYCVSTIAGKLPVWPTWVSTSNSISRLSFWKCWIAGLYNFLLHFVVGFSGHLRNMTIWWLYYRFLIGTGVLAGTFYHCSLPQSHLRGLGNLGTNNVGYITVWPYGDICWFIIYKRPWDKPQPHPSVLPLLLFHLCRWRILLEYYVSCRNAGLLKYNQEGYLTVIWVITV